MTDSVVQTETKTVPNVKYAILQETNGEEFESWLYFIRYEGNEEALNYLQKQLERVDWYILDGLSTFDLDLQHLVTENTAKEMIRVDLNHYSFHRKFDGTLKKIDFAFKDRHSNEKKMSKAFEVLGYGKIENFIDKEDIDPENMKNETMECASSDSSDSSSGEENAFSGRKTARKSRSPRKRHGRI